MPWQRRSTTLKWSVIKAPYVVALNTPCAVQRCLRWLMVSEKCGKICRIFPVAKRLWLVMRLNEYIVNYWRTFAPKGKHHGEQTTVISGYPEGTTSEQLMMYFQSRRRSGGGDVEDIQLQEGQAVVTFEREEGMFTWKFMYFCISFINMLLNQFGVLRNPYGKLVKREGFLRENWNSQISHGTTYFRMWLPFRFVRIEAMTGSG